jgi:two-component system, cell cycle sensor histidine kinase and response regulator CckA
MNVRAIVLVLALSSLISTFVGSYLYYHSEREAATKEAEVEFASRSTMLHEHLARRISTDSMAARSLSLFEEVQQALDTPTPERLQQANRILDHFASGLDYDACYVMDRDGNTVASSNRHRADSFVGQNYSFRPYFIAGMQGLPRVYMAVGVTSRQRGVYFSHPVYLPDRPQAVGIAVIKSSADKLEQEMLRPDRGIALVLHTSGMIFASNRPDWVLSLLWKTSAEQLAGLAETQQFGKGPWKWSGLEQRAADRARDSDGNTYWLSEEILEKCPEWRTVYLQRLPSLTGRSMTPLAGWTGYVLFAVMALVFGAVFFLYSMAQRDILSRKRAEEVLRTERAKFESLADDAPFGMATISPDGTFLYVNTRFKEIFGFDLSDIPTGRDWFRKAYPDTEYRHRVIAAWIEDLQATVPGEQRPRVFTVTCKGGTQKIVHFRPVRLTTGEHLMTCEDITERWQAEEKLRQSEDQFRRIIANLQDLFYRTDMHGNFTFLSPAAERITGYTPDEALGRPVSDFYVDPSERKEFMKLILKHGFVHDFESRVKHKNGEAVWVSVSSRLYTDAEGNIAGVEGIARDIGDRKRMELALAEKEEKFRLLAEQSLMSVAILQKGVYRYANEAMASLLEFTTDEILAWQPEEFPKVVHPDDRDLVLRQARMKQTGDPGQVPNYEFRVLTQSGAVKWVEIYSKTIQFEGMPANLLTMVDITERKRAEEERALYAQRLQALIQLGHMRGAPLNQLVAFAMEEAVRLTQSSIGYVAFANEDETVLTMHAWSENAMSQCAISDKPLVYPVKDTGLWGEAVRQRRAVITNDYAVPNPLKRGIPEGHVHMERHMNVPIFDNGRIVIVAGVGNKNIDYDENDVRQLTLLMEGMWRIVLNKRAEEALQESEQRFRVAFQTSPDAVNINRVHDGVYSDVNQGFTELTGYTKEEVIGRSSSEINIWHDPKDRARLAAILKEHGYVRNFEAGFRLKDGRVRTGLMSARMIIINGEPHSLSVTRDIEDWKKAEQALFESEQRYKDLFDNSSDLIYTHDLRGNFTSTNEAVTRILGYSPEECRALNVTQILHPDYALRTKYRSSEGPSDGLEPSGPYEVAAQAKDGRLVWLEVTSRLIHSGGEVTGVHGTARDITARKESEAEHSRLVTAIEQAGESIFITDPMGRILYVNPAFEVTTGYSREEVIGQKPSLLKSGKQDEAFYKDMWNTFQRGDVWRGQLINRRKDGTLYEANATISPIKDETGRIVNFVAVKRDVSAELILQRQLLHAQKMEAIGTLAGGIAHDFNNLLQAILGYADLLLLRKKATDPDRQKIEIIRHAARDGADLVSRILTFSRTAEAKARPLDLNEEIRRVERLLRRTVPKMIEIKLALSEDLWIIDADPAQMEQMFLNLAVNAQHAMADGGELVIKTRNVSLDNGYVLTHLGARPGKYVAVTLSDTGTGMSQHVVDRMFEPFFTTKTDGQGTGLGLAMVHGIVSQHGGYIRCYSEPGKGTAFRIYFPASQTAQLLEPAEAQEAPPAGTETLLLVDDDDRIREMAQEMIQRHGYQVMVARSGEEALDIYASQGPAISLVILDIIMPGMGGKRCLEELLRMDPEAKVLLASGYAFDDHTQDETDQRARGFVGKPYDAKLILRAIREVLDTGRL